MPVDENGNEIDEDIPVSDDDDYISNDGEQVNGRHKRNKRVSGRADALMEQFKQATEALYSGTESVASERLIDDSPYTNKTMAMLEDPDLLDRLVDFAKPLVRDVDDVWRALYLAQASCYAPPIRQGKKTSRAQNHILLIGDPSTGKSQLYRNAMKMFPKCKSPTDFTPSAFVGSYNRKRELQVGIAAQMDKAIMVVDEFEKLLTRYPHLDGYMRVIMEEQMFYRKTAYGVVEYETRPVVFAGANPKGDTFRDELMAKQIPFKYGLVTRFDYLRPMCYSCSDVVKISRDIAEQSFQDTPILDGELTHMDVCQVFYGLQQTLMDKMVTKVIADKEMVKQLQETFSHLQKEIDGVPLLSVRDFMGGLRFFNSSATLHCAQRQVINQGLVAQQEDVDNAIYLMENSARSREIMLTTERRNEMARSPLERSKVVLLAYLQANGNSVDKMSAVDYLKTTMGISKTTAYEYIKDMVLERDGEIVQSGLRDATLMLRP